MDFLPTLALGTPIYNFHAVVDKHNNSGDTALALATEPGHNDIVKILLDNHVNVEIDK